MRLTRIHVPGPLAEAAQLALPRQAGEHLTRVLRLAPGATFTLFDGAGGEYTATLLPPQGQQVQARVGRHVPLERESPLDITLLQGVARGERMDFIVQKATELGVNRIVPVLAERSIVKLDAQQADRKRGHWQSVAISACEQCGRNRIPRIDAPVGLGDALRALSSGGIRCLLAAEASSSLATVVRTANGPLVLLIGPEGGLAEGEEQVAQANQFFACRLGPRILRTETAGLAALAAIQTIAGDFSS